jgi:hypothetical protein
LVLRTREPWLEGPDAERYEEGPEDELGAVRSRRGKTDRQPNRSRDEEHEAQAALLEPSRLNARLGRVGGRRSRCTVGMGPHTELVSKRRIKIP